MFTGKGMAVGSGFPAGISMVSVMSWWYKVSSMIKRSEGNECVLVILNLYLCPSFFHRYVDVLVHVLD